MNYSILDTYSQPYGGVFSGSVKLPNNLGEPYYPIYSCSIGNLKHISFLKNNNFGRDTVETIIKAVSKDDNDPNC